MTHLLIRKDMKLKSRLTLPDNFSMKYKKHKGWRVSIDRPEEIYENARAYYTDDEIERYARSGAIRKTQEKIAYRILELLDIDRGKILDLGCGPGFTAKVYEREEFQVTGLDNIPEMLKKAECNYVLGDMKNLTELFKEKKFDAVVSASALQWIKDIDIKKVASGIHYILKYGGKLVIQFYPKSEEEMIKTAREFKKAGFEGRIIIDNPDNAMKRVIFLVFRKI